MTKELLKGKLTKCYICLKDKTQYYTTEGIPTCKGCREIYLGWPNTSAKVVTPKPATRKTGTVVTKKPEGMSNEAWDAHIKVLKKKMLSLKKSKTATKKKKLKETRRP